MTILWQIKDVASDEDQDSTFLTDEGLSKVEGLSPE